MFTIKFYELPNGHKPVNEFIKRLSPKMQAKAVYSISLLAEFGTQLREPYSKHVCDGIFELRIKFAADAVRIFYFFFDNTEIVLTNGFIKKTKRTPAKELKKAEKYKADYERRYLK